MTSCVVRRATYLRQVVICVSVCVQNISESYERIVMKSLGGKGRGKGTIDRKYLKNSLLTIAIPIDSQE